MMIDHLSHLTKQHGLPEDMERFLFFIFYLHPQRKQNEKKGGWVGLHVYSMCVFVLGADVGVREGRLKKKKKANGCHGDA